MVIQTVLSQNTQSKYLKQHGSFQWFMENFQIAEITANHKCTVLSIGDKITTCEWLYNGSSKSKITCEK